MSSNENGNDAAAPNDPYAVRPDTQLLASRLKGSPVISESVVASRAVAGKTFRIVRTLQLDPYEKEEPPEVIAASSATLNAAPGGDNFRGRARRAAKLSIADADVEDFDDVRDLIATLPAHEDMVNHDPPITTSPDSDRVEEEERNVRVRTFLYAASREDDNDFHLILGRDPGASEMYMNMEISGLPAPESEFFETLRDARDAFKDFFGDNLPGLSYDFYDPPIPVMVEGSLFFDASHSSGQRPGPQSLRDDIPTVWELHPITSIEFEP